ncbi:MAG: hypothetical protein J6A96_04270 [Clostridia bacterium]|nr:hypothetical protein [Clostridia bacterium]
MELKDLAPWIAIAITLALSILVPLFTQIANNRHQRKLQQEQFEREERQKKAKAYEAFLSEVGGIITARGFVDAQYLSKAGASLYQVYIYSPAEWHEDLDALTEYIMKKDWEQARKLIQLFSRLISIELK